MVFSTKPFYARKAVMGSWKHLLARSQEGFFRLKGTGADRGFFRSDRTERCLRRKCKQYRRCFLYRDGRRGRAAGRRFFRRTGATTGPTASTSLKIIWKSLPRREEQLFSEKEFTYFLPKAAVRPCRKALWKQPKVCGSTISWMKSTGKRAAENG